MAHALPPLDTLALEFESLSLDERAFLVIRSEEDLEVCVHFQRKEAPRVWAVWFKLSPEASRQQCSREHLAAVLAAFRVREGHLSSELATRLLTQAAYADEFVRTVGELLGEDAVRESIRSTQTFMENLKEMVRRTVGPGEPAAPKPVVRQVGAIDEAGQGIGSGKGHLRVVRNKDV